MIITQSLVTLFIVCAGGISDFPSFKSAVAEEQPVIELSGSFLFQSNVVVNHDCVVTASDDVILDLSNFYITFDGGTHTIGSADAAITFRNGGYTNVQFRSLNSAIKTEVYNCHFDYSQGGNGVNLRCYYDLDVVFYACSANYNSYDGFNIHSLPDAVGSAYVVLVDCCASYNDPDGLGGPRGDGITAHDNNQVFEVIGGHYCNNGKSGAAMVYGSDLVVDGATFENNGWVSYIRDVYLSGDGAELLWYSGYTESAYLNGSAHIYGGVVNSFYLAAGSEVYVYGFWFNGENFISSCWEDSYVSANYTPVDIAIPGDINNNNYLDFDDLACVLNGLDIRCDGSLLLSDVSVFQTNFYTLK